MAPGLFLGYDVTPKLAFLYLAAALLLVRFRAWAPGVAALWRTSIGRLFCCVLAAQAVSLLISAALASDRVLAFGGTSFRRLGAITQIVLLFISVVLAACVTLDRRLRRRLLIAVEISGAIVSVYGIAQYFGWDPWLAARLYTVEYAGDVVRPPGTLRHAVYFANFLAPVILIAGASALHPGGRSRWLHGAACAMATAALVLTGTRSALLGLAAGAGLIVYLEARRSGSRKILVYTGNAAVAGMLTIAIFAISPAGGSLRVRFKQWIDDAKGGTRLLVWRDSGRLIRDHWLVGIGPEAFAGEFRKVQSLELSRAYPEHFHEDPHNILIGATASQGIPGVIVLLAWIGLGFVAGYRSATVTAPSRSRLSINASEPRGLPSGTLSACLLALLVSAQFSPFTLTNWLYLDVIVALLVAAGLPQAESVAVLPVRLPARPMAWSAALLLVLAAGVHVGQDSLIAAAGHLLAQGDMAGAREAYERASRFPLSADHLWCSQQAAATARVLRSPWREDALGLAKEASAAAEHGAEQRFSGLYQSAVLAVVTGDLSTAQAKLRAAIQAAPWWYRAHLMLSKVLTQSGAFQQAAREADLALSCAGASERKVRTALAQLRK